MELTELKNIGVEMKRKLNTIGINDAETLRKFGSKEAFIRLKIEFPAVCLVHLHVLQGAIDNIEFNMLSEEIKTELKKFNDSL